MILEAVPFSSWKLPLRKAVSISWAAFCLKLHLRSPVESKTYAASILAAKKEANAGIEMSLSFFLGYHPSGFRNQSAAFGDKVGPFAFHVFPGEQDGIGQRLFDPGAEPVIQARKDKLAGKPEKGDCRNERKGHRCGDEPGFEFGAEDVSFPLENEFYEIAQDEIGEQQKEQHVQIDENNKQYVAEKRRV